MDAMTLHNLVEIIQWMSISLIATVLVIHVLAHD